MNLVDQTSRVVSNNLKHHNNFNQSSTRFQFWCIYKGPLAGPHAEVVYLLRTTSQGHSRRGSVGPRGVGGGGHII